LYAECEVVCMNTLVVQLKKNLSLRSNIDFNLLKKFQKSLKIEKKQRKTTLPECLSLCNRRSMQTTAGKTEKDGTE
jgi:hypothetical protein